MQTQQRKKLTGEQLLAGALPDGDTDNRWFLPSGSENKKPHPVAFSLSFGETPMQCNQAKVDINDKRINLFPAATLRLASDVDALLPVDRDLIRDIEGNSYWDLTLSPGKVWTEVEDNGWSRAALPFQLSNIFENDTHHGIAMFLYNQDSVSPVYYQIVAETKAFLCPDQFFAGGYLQASIVKTDAKVIQPVVESYRQEQQHQRPLKSLQHWRNETTEPYFNDLEHGFGYDSTLISGLVIDDEIYCTPCATAYGDYPYPRAMKFGIWSATKTAFCSIACLRLAQIIEEDPRNAIVSDLLPEAKDNPEWQGITIGDCLNMASGIGTAAPEPKSLNIFADYLLEYDQAKGSALGLKSYDHYFDWFLAPSQHEKNIAAFACPSYPWEPGTVARYRDQDLYIAGAALDALLKKNRGTDARIWDMVCDEVYLPAHIYHAVKFHTIEVDAQKEVPLSDAGLLLTMDNIAGLSTLIVNRGKIGNEQILDSIILDEIFNPEQKKGLPTGTHTTDGEIHYHGGTWHLPHKSGNEKTYWIPTMRGYGGQTIQTLPNGMTAFRFGFDSYETEERYDFLKLARLADAIRPFR